MAGVPQDSNLGLLLFLIYVNDLSEGLSTNAKLFLDDTSLFFVIYDKQTSANELNNDLEMIHNWVFNGKWILTQNVLNKLKKSSLIVKQKNYLILP